MEEFKDEEYYNNLDKRTSEYKEWKAQFEQKQEEQSNGLGDTVAKITKATGIEKAVKTLFGDSCGCDERKEKLNELFPANKPLCLEPDEHAYLAEWFSKNTNQIKPTDQRRLLEIYNRVLRYNKKPTNCASCFKSVVRSLRKYYEAYS